ncbi:MAG: UDP-N-acetylmuramoyl-L-alanyl-D-glutamate--2,6-diaminopimelate ligase [Candidatus Eisenbacteria bacterium]|nr:UDP-N-acetylmuramoyl-L-alanyl-D-glutamate--2,6-diaminopimelate ligase [Candidatus Eisenbacteria bacterium]
MRPPRRRAPTHCDGGNLSVALDDLLRPIPADLWWGPPPELPVIAIRGLCCDSRRARAGELFFALRGTRRDGTRFVGEAVARGVAGVVSEAALDLPAGRVGLRVRDARRALGICAAQFHGRPSRRVRVVGITGTDGKTSSAWFARHLLARQGRRAVALGTLGILDAQGRTRDWQPGSSGEVEVARTWHPTTPEAPRFQATLAALAAEGVEDVVCEVSSHALAQDRVYGTQFAAVALTHLATDHLDYHGSAEAYRAAKARLFARETRGGPLEERPVLAVLNLDDPLGRMLATRSEDPRMTYGRDRGARVRCLRTEESPAGIRLSWSFDGQPREIATPLHGEFHATNLLTAAAICYGLDVRPAAIASALEQMPPVPGRFEALHEGQPFAVIVDYAHTTDGLGSLLRAARQIDRGRLIVVFGCGGDRDARKREAMGRVAGRLADHVVVTSDNPRSESPRAIAEQILGGLRGGRASWEVELDRRAALARGVALARRGDILVAAGKGAEAQQIHAGHIEEIDDREVLRSLLRS